MPLFGAIPSPAAVPSPTTTSWPMPVPPNPPPLPAHVPATPRTINSFLSNLHTLYRPAGRESMSSSFAAHRSKRTPRMSIPALFPSLPNPFENIHPAFRSAAARSPTSVRSVIESPIPGARNSSRFSGLASNPFSRRSQPESSAEHDIEEQDVPFVFDHNAHEEHVLGSVESSQVSRQWPSGAGHERQRRTRRRRSHKKTRAPMLFPAMRSHRVRVKMFHSILFGGIFILLLIIYLALHTTNASTDSFQIPFVIIFILLTIALSHSLVRLWLLVRRWNAKFGHRVDSKNVYIPRDRAIPVTVARDEEIGLGNRSGPAGEESDEESIKNVAPPPPAYGLWRGSVRVDPNLLHWQRRGIDTRSQTSGGPTDAVPRPPSYTPPSQHSARMDGGYF